MKKIASLFLLCLLTSCATKYQPNTWLSSGGYKDTRLGADTFIINYEGNGFSDMITIYKYALIRAAEVARENGYEYFILLTNESFKSTSCSMTTIGNSPYLSSSTSPTVNLTIKAFREMPATDSFFTVSELMDHKPCSSSGRR